MTTKDTKNRAVYYINTLFGRPSAIASSAKKMVIIESAFRFFIAFLFSWFPFYDDFSPFAYSFASISGVGVEGLSAVLGATLGYLFHGFNIVTARYIFSCVLCFLTLTLLRRLSISEKSFFRPAVITTVSASTGFVFITDINAAAVFAIETLCVFFSSYAFRYAMSPRTQNPQFSYGLSVAFFAGLAFSSLSGLVLFAVMSLGRFFAVILLMVTAYKCGYSKVCPLAIIMGILMDISGGKDLFFTFVYPFSAVISSIFNKRGSFLFALSYVISNLLASVILYGNYFFLPSLYETFAGSVIFLLIPKSVLAKFYALFPHVMDPNGSVRSRTYIKNRLELAADAFRELYCDTKSMVNINSNDEDIASIFDRAAEISCRKCKKMSTCWHTGYQVTLNVLNDLTSKMVSDGYIDKSDFPSYFSDRCVNLDLFTSALNSELRSLVYRRQYKSKYNENLIAAYNHYADMYLILKNTASEVGGNIDYDYKTERKVQKFLKSMDIPVSASVFKDNSGRLHVELFGTSADMLLDSPDWLDSMSEALGVRLCTTGQIEDGRLVILEAEPYCVSIGLSSLSKDNDNHSGDTGRFFKTDSGIMYIILSDGVGTGKGAEKISRETIKVLELFLKAGFPPETALRILSDAMLLKNEADIYTATIDLMCIDLFSGSCKIYKSGAAPTYVRSGSNVKKLKCTSFFPGFSKDDDFAPDSVKLNFSPDSSAVIISDGILGDSNNDKWLQDIISHWENSSPTEIAKMITAESEKLYGRNDDMTAICVTLSTRK